MVEIDYFDTNPATGYLELRYKHGHINVFIECEIEEEHDQPCLIVSVYLRGYGEALNFIDVRDIPDEPVTAEFLINIVSEYFQHLADKKKTLH